LPKQNARFVLKRKFSTGKNDCKINKSLFAAGDIGYFPLVACRDIAAGEEIIVDYGHSYWRALAEWMLQPKKKTQKTIDRDNRKCRRDEAKTESYKTNSNTEVGDENEGNQQATTTA
jgi:SET domain-containing protein